MVFYYLFGFSNLPNRFYYLMHLLQVIQFIFHEQILVLFSAYLYLFNGSNKTLYAVYNLLFNPSNHTKDNN